MAQRFIYAFDCGTTNWRIYRLSCEEIVGDGGTCQLHPVSDPQLVALTTFTSTGHILPAALLLDKSGQVHSYGENAYESARDPVLCSYLRDAFKLCIGNHQATDPLNPLRRYTHKEALTYTRLLLAQVVTWLGKERPGSLEGGHIFFFAHPVHWGRENDAGTIKGEILVDFADIVRGCFPERLQGNVHFVPEPEGALVSLLQSGQLSEVDSNYTLVVDIGGGTTDFVVGKWTPEGLQDVRHYGELHGSGLFDHDLAEYLAEVLQVPEEQWEEAWTELHHYGRRLKERISHQAQVNEAVPVTMNVMLQLPPGKDGKPVFLNKISHFSCQDFESRTQRTTAALNELVLQALVQMDLRKSDVGQVVLVGGGTNLYLVPRLLKKIFGDSLPVVYSDPPEHTVVRGTALWPVRHGLQIVTNETEESSNVIDYPPENEKANAANNQGTDKVEEDGDQVKRTNRNGIYTMEDNQQIREEMTKVQVELESALKEMISVTGNKLKPEERREIENEFKELNELLERLKTGLVWVALFGKTSVGKSAIANSLMGADVARVGVEHDLTTEATGYKKFPWMLVDVPGIMGEEINEKVAIEEAKKAHGHILVLEGEPYGDEIELFDLVDNALPETPKIVFVNKWDVIEATKTKKDQEVVRARIEKKMGKYVRSPIDIVYGSAMIKNAERDVMVRQELPQLLDRMYEDAGTLGQVMNILDPANRASNLSQNIKDKVLAIRTQVARRVINGFALASAFSGAVPFSTLIVTPGILASMVYVIFLVMGKKQDKVSATKVTIELLKACGITLGAIFGAVIVAEVLVDVATTALTPVFGIGALLGLAADVVALGYFKYQRTVILGEVTMEYIRNDCSWGADGQEAVILRCRDRAKEHYSRLRKK